MRVNLITLLVFVSFVHVFATSHAQQLSFKAQKPTVERVFSEIRKQTGYTVLYSGLSLKGETFPSVDFKKKPLHEVLTQLSEIKGWNYEIDGKTIILRKKRPVVFELLTEKETQQEFTATGIVVDSSGNVLPGVSIRESGTTNATSSNDRGEFTLNVSGDKAKLDFSFMGYRRVESITAGVDLRIVLHVDDTKIDEVVVVGYGTQRKSDLTGSVVSIGEKDFTEGANSNALQLLNGKAAGVAISQTSSAPGASTKIQIRGAGSINSSNTTLVVVDGLPGVDPSDISPDDIQSIEILKDASSAAIYGTRAANGVVLITTKKGSSGTPVIRYNTYIGTQSVAKKIDVLNGRQYMETLNAIRTEEGKDVIYTQDQINEVGEGTYWQDEIFNKTASVQNHQISISGGNDKSDYYAGLNYFTQNGLVKNSDFNKLNFRTNLNFKPKDYLSFKLNTNFN